jgi:hypothetical protein
MMMQGLANPQLNHAGTPDAPNKNALFKNILVAGGAVK